MNKAEFVGQLASRFDGNKAQATRVLDIVVDEIMTQTAKSGQVSIAGFGVFEVHHRPDRTVRNPRTGERKDVPAEDIPKFRPGTTFKGLVSEAGSKPAKKKKK